MAGDFLELWGFSSAVEKPFNLKFSEYVSVSLPAKDWKTCLDSSAFMLSVFLKVWSILKPPFFGWLVVF